MGTKMKVSPLINILGILSFSFLSLVAVNLESNLAEAQNEQPQKTIALAVANEVLITASPRQDHVAEKYLKEATGQEEIAIIDNSYSAVTLHIPLDEKLPEGAVVSEDEIASACKDFQGYIRRLRRNNAENRRRDQKPSLVYNLQCGPNSIVTTSALPNDKRFSELWAASNSILDVDLDLPAAWNKATGSENVVVAVVDTGVDSTHPDLIANMWKNLAEVNGVGGVDDDGNGVIDDIHGFNAIDGTGNPIDDNNHGTHVAGTIGAAGNNKIGVVGVNWKVKLMAVKFMTSAGSGTMSDAVKALDYVTNMKLAGVNIVASNNSWGLTSESPALLSAISRSNNANILFIAAAGNAGLNIDSTPYYPASYSQSNIISVGAVAALGNLPTWTNYGLQNVDLVAPGENILSCLPNNTYGYLSGTSMAAPQVTGALALLKGYAPDMTVEQLKSTLFNTSKSELGAIGKTVYGSMPSVSAMLNEADRLGLNNPSNPGPTPLPTISRTPTPIASPTATPMPTPMPTPTAAPGYYNFLVTIVDASSQDPLPLAKFEVEINGVRTSGYTDNSGRVSLMNVFGLSGSTANLYFSHTGYPTRLSSITLGNPAYPTYWIWSNFGENKYPLRAKVTDKNGIAVVGVTVKDPILGAATTSSLGIAEFLVPYGTNYSLSVSKYNSDFLSPTLSGQIKGAVTRSFVMLPK